MDPGHAHTLSQGLALPDDRPTGPRSGVPFSMAFFPLHLCQAPPPPPLETASSQLPTLSASTARTGAGVSLRQANGDSDGDEDRPSALPPRPRVPRHYRLPRPEGVNQHVPQEPIPSVWNRCPHAAAQRRSAETDSNSRHAVEARDGIRCLCPGFGRRTEV